MDPPYRDNDRSAFKRGVYREHFERLLTDVEAGLIDVVLVWRFDRLSRDPLQLERLVAASLAHGVRCESMTEHVDWRNPRKAWSAIRRHVLDAEDESIVKSERVSRAHEEIAEEGRVSGGGLRPFGYEADRTTVRLDEAKLIKDAAERVLGGDSLRAIVSDWRVDGVATVTGATWSSTTLKRLLTSARLSGQREHHGVIVATAVWPKILEPEQTEALRAVLRDPQRNRHAGVVVRSYLLTGFLVCARCQVKMTSRPTGRGKRRYVCTKDRGGCDRNGISADGLDDLIRDAVLLRLDSDAVHEALSGDRDAVDRTALLASLHEDEEALKALAHDHYVARPPLIGRAEFVAARAAIDRRMAGVRKALERAASTSALAGLPRGQEALRAEWDRRGLDGRRSLIEAVLETIEVAPTQRADNRFNPERVMPPHGPRWRDRTVER